MSDGGDQPEPDDDRGSSNAAVLIGVAALITIAWLVMHFYMQNQAMENCRIEGRRDCDPITVPNP